MIVLKWNQWEIMPRKENMNTTKLQRIFLCSFCRTAMLRCNIFFIMNPMLLDIILVQNINFLRCNARAYVLVYT